MIYRQQKKKEAKKKKNNFKVMKMKKKRARDVAMAVHEGTRPAKKKLQHDKISENDVHENVETNNAQAIIEDDGMMHGDDDDDDEAEYAAMSQNDEDDEIDYEAKRQLHHIDLSLEFVREKLRSDQTAEMAFFAFKKLVFQTLEQKGFRTRGERNRYRRGIGESRNWGRQFPSEMEEQETPAWKVFLEGVAGDPHVDSLESLDDFCRSIARRLIGNQRFRSFFRVFDFMFEELEIPFKVAHYNMMIDVHLQQGYFRGAKKILQDMVVAGVQPKASTFNHFMRANVMFDKVEMAEDVLEEMKSMDVEPDTDSFNWIIRGYGKRRNMDKMEEAMEMIKERGLTPNMNTYTALIEGYLASRNMRMATQHYENLMNEFGLVTEEGEDGKGVRPRRIKQQLFVTMIQEAAKRLEIDKALEYLGHLESAKIRRRSIDPYFALTAAFVNKGDTENAEKMLDRALRMKVSISKPEIVNKIISGYIHERQPWKVNNLLDRISELKVRPSPRELSDTVLALVHQNKREEAQALSARVRKQFKIKIFDDAAQVLDSASQTFEDIQIKHEFADQIVDSLQRLSERSPLISFHFVMTLMQHKTLHLILTADFLRALFFALKNRGHSPQLMARLLFECIRPLDMHERIGHDLLVRHIATEYCNTHDGAEGMMEFYNKLLTLEDVTENLLFLVAKKVMNIFEQQPLLLKDSTKRSFLESELQRFVISGKRTHVMKDRAACQSAIACLARLGRIEDTIRMVKRVNKTLGSGSVEAKAFLPLLDRYMLEQRDAEKAEKLLEFMLRHSVRVDEEFFTCMQNGFVELGLLEKAESVVDRMVSLHVGISEKQFHILMAAYAERDDLQSMHLTIKKMEQHGFIVDLHSYWWLLEKCFSQLDGKEGVNKTDVDSQMVQEALQNIKDQGISISTTSFNFLQLLVNRDLQHSKKMDGSAMSRPPCTVFDRMDQILFILKHEEVVPDSFILNTLLNLCQTSDEMREVMQRLEERVGVQASDTHLAMLVRMLLNESRQDDAIALLKKRLPNNTQLAREVSWTALDKLFATTGQSERMTEYLMLLSNYETRISPCIPTSVITALAQDGHTQLALDTMEDLRANFSLPPNIVMINSIIGGLIQQAQFDSVKNLIDTAVSTYNVNITAQTFAIIVSECIRFGHEKHVDEFIDIFTSGPFASHREDETNLFELLVEMHIERGQLEKAEQHFSTISAIARPSAHIMNMLLRAYIRAGLMSKASELVARMQKNNVHPEQGTFQCLILSQSVLHHSERPALPLLMLNCMSNAGISPGQQLLNTVQNYYEQVGDVRLLSACKSLRRSLSARDNDIES